jgi:hypothetical protein
VLAFVGKVYVLGTLCWVVVMFVGALRTSYAIQFLVGMLLAPLWPVLMLAFLLDD